MFLTNNETWSYIPNTQQRYATKFTITKYDMHLKLLKALTLKYEKHRSTQTLKPRAGFIRMAWFMSRIGTRQLR